MSHSVMTSELVLELSTDEQQLLAGGFRGRGDDNDFYGGRGYNDYTPNYGCFPYDRCPSKRRDYGCGYGK